MEQILTSCSASISELKKNPTALLNEAEGAPIAILNHNVPVAYLVPAKTYEWIMDKIEDAELAQIVKNRAHEKKKASGELHPELSRSRGIIRKLRSS